MSLLKPFNRLMLPIKLATSDPRITGAILLAILFNPEKLKSTLPDGMYSVITSERFVSSLKVLLSLGVIRTVNNKLSQYVLNNWKTHAKFVKSQEVVLVTGGCSGIGLLMATQFAKMGTKVAIIDLAAPKTTLPHGIHFFQCDVTSPLQIKVAATEIRKAVGEPTVLINNAGIGSGATILDGSEDIIRRTFEVNIISHFWMVREFLPAMIKKNHGHVVTIASLASYVVHAGNVDYSCSKASALAFHEGLAVELRARYNAPNVRTTVVNPSWIRTPLVEPLLAKPGFNDPVLEPEEVVSQIVNQVVSGKSGQLIIPKKAAFLATIRSWPYWMSSSARNHVAHVLEGGILLAINGYLRGQNDERAVLCEYQAERVPDMFHTSGLPHALMVSDRRQPYDPKGVHKLISQIINLIADAISMHSRWGVLGEMQPIRSFTIQCDVSETHFLVKPTRALSMRNSDAPDAAKLLVGEHSTFRIREPQIFGEYSYHRIRPHVARLPRSIL